MNILLRKCRKPIYPSSQLTKRYLHEGKRLVLGIESSCDDSCAALVREDGKILSSVQKGQNTITRQFRGVVPLLASKSHEINLPIVVNQCLNELGKDEILSSIDAVALTIGPGLAPCLGVGLTFAKEFCKKYQKPLILVNHMEAHAMVATMNHQVFYPSFGLMVSGGNTEIVYIPDHCHSFLKIGDTMDDACGECMDKICRHIMDILHPEVKKEKMDISTITKDTIQSMKETPLSHGGAQISKWSKQYEETEEYKQGGKRIDFPLPMSRQHNANFSFSGIKTFAIRYLDKMEKEGLIDELSIQRFCYYFEHTLIKHIIKKLCYALDEFPEVHSIV